MKPLFAVIRPVRSLGVLASVIIAPAVRSPAFLLPAPTGSYGVGTTSWNVTDPNRMESLSAAPARREVKVVAWYPTSPVSRNRRGTRAPYLRESIIEARTFASLVGAPGVFDDLAAVETHSILDEAVVPGTAKLPVLVFSHGYTELISAYMSLLEDLASHGYIVLSIAHPYEVVAATLSNGSMVTITDSTGKMRREVQDVLSEWNERTARWPVSRAPLPRRSSSAFFTDT